MPEMMVIGGVVLGRGDERIEPPIGKPFDFTADEIDTLLKDSPPPIRALKDESEGNPEAGKSPVAKKAEVTSPPKPSVAAGNPLAKKAGKAEDDGEL
jgi:hypothetical protein